MTVLIPPIFFGLYAITRYSGKANKRAMPALIISGTGTLIIFKLGLYSSNKEIDQYNKELYDKYKDEVIHPKYRGLKLYKKKKAY